MDTDDGNNAPSMTTFSDAAFSRNGVSPSAIGYNASLPRAGRPLRLSTPRYSADEESVRGILCGCCLSTERPCGSRGKSSTKRWWRGGCSRGRGTRARL